MEKNGGNSALAVPFSGRAARGWFRRAKSAAEHVFPCDGIAEETFRARLERELLPMRIADQIGAPHVQAAVCVKERVLHIDLLHDAQKQVV